MTKATSYHHGDLRQTLVQEASILIQEGGTEALSMRKLAERAGVSRTAPYHHFRDKNDLLCAIAEEGFKQQDSMLNQQLAEPDHSAYGRFENYVLAYLNLAHNNAATYDLMFGKEIWKSGQPTESLKEVSRHSFKCWVDEIAHLQEQGLFTRDIPPLRVAQTSWATLHGLCRLFNDGIYVNPQEMEAIAKSSTALLCNGATV